MEKKTRYIRQLVLKNSKLDLGLGPGVLTEEVLHLSERTIELMNKGDEGIRFAKTECDMQFLMEHIEVTFTEEETT